VLAAVASPLSALSDALGVGAIADPFSSSPGAGPTTRSRRYESVRRRNPRGLFKTVKPNMAGSPCQALAMALNCAGRRNQRSVMLSSYSFQNPRHELLAPSLKPASLLGARRNAKNEIELARDDSDLVTPPRQIE
jgi:hypothetical protein